MLPTPPSKLSSGAATLFEDCTVLEVEAWAGPRGVVDIAFCFLVRYRISSFNGQVKLESMENFLRSRSRELSHMQEGN